MSLRLALVVRRYWPASGREERAWRRHVAALTEAGASVTVFTPQWHASWPERLTIDRAETIRLAPGPSTTLRVVRWTYGVTREISKRRREFDAIIVSGTEEEAASLLTAVSESPPVIVHVAESGEEGSIRLAKKRVFGESLLHACRNAAAVITESETALAELRREGFASEKTFAIPRACGTLENLLPRELARRTLAEVNRDLESSPGAPIVCYGGRWIPERGLRDLLFAWQKAIQVRPEAKLWLVGDGPERDSLYSHVRDLELKYHTAMPGTFETWDDLLAAVDVFVAPAREEGSFLSIAEAMAAGTPIVATDLPIHRERLIEGESARLVSPGKPDDLAEAIVESWLMPEAADRRAMKAREFMERCSDERTAAEWFAVIRSVVR